MMQIGWVAEVMHCSWATKFIHVEYRDGRQPSCR